MRIGAMGNLAYSVAGTGPFDVDALIEDCARARRDGLASYWIGQQMDWDAFSLLTALAREVPDIELGTAVTHVWTAFPVHMAQQAMSVQVLSKGRFTLGLGLEHDWVIREMWGLDWNRPVSMLAEYLEIVRSLLWKGRVEHQGEFFNVRSAFLRFAPDPEMQIILAALGPRMLRLAGSRANGTTTWFTGARTLREHIVPRIKEAAEQAERPQPRVIALLPIAVTASVATIRERVTAEMQLYHRMPSYRAMLEREGVTNVGEIGLFGSTSEVEAALADLRDSGVTDFGAIFVGSASEQQSTRQLLHEWAARSRQPATVTTTTRAEVSDDHD